MFASIFRNIIPLKINLEITFMEKLKSLPIMTRQDLDEVLDSYEQAKIKLGSRTEQHNLDKLNRMAEQAIFRFYNQPVVNCPQCKLCNRECDNCESCGTAVIERE